MRVDLHIHSTASDGTWSPEAVVRGAAEGGLDVIALADHDTVAGYEAAAAVGREVRVQVVPGIEVSSTHAGREIHILGFFVDPRSAVLLDHTERAGRRREERMHEMIERLVAAGREVTFQDVEHAAGPERVNIGRPHLAKALIERGHVATMHEAFDTLIGDAHDAFVPMHLLEPAGAVEVVLGAGGIPIWAHPPGDLVDPLLRPLIDAGLRGLEVYRPKHRNNSVVRLEQLCRSSGLLMSGGSDWHGPEGGSVLGDFFVGADEIPRLLEEGGL